MWAWKFNCEPRYTPNGHRRTRYRSCDGQYANYLFIIVDSIKYCKGPSHMKPICVLPTSAQEFLVVPWSGIWIVYKCLAFGSNDSSGFYQVAPIEIWMLLCRSRPDTSKLHLRERILFLDCIQIPEQPCLFLILDHLFRSWANVSPGRFRSDRPSQTLRVTGMRLSAVSVM